MYGLLMRSQVMLGSERFAAIFADERFLLHGKVIFHMGYQQVFASISRITYFAFERLFRIRRVDPYVVPVNAFLFSEGLITYLTTKQVRILVPLTMLEQHSLLEKLLVAALGIHMLFVYGAEVLLQILEAFGHKLTFVADKWAEFPDQYVHVFVACVNFWFCCRNRRIDCS